MKRLRSMALVSLASLAAGMVFAQAGGGRDPGPGPGAQSGSPAATAPSPGPRATRGPGARWGSEYTPGWSLMTKQERNEHRERMRSMKNYDECKTYMEQRREQMAARAKERGGKALGQPRRDGCARLKP